MSAEETICIFYDFDLSCFREKFAGKHGRGPNDVEESQFLRALPEILRGECKRKEDLLISNYIEVHTYHV